MAPDGFDFFPGHEDFDLFDFRNIIRQGIGQGIYGCHLGGTAAGMILQKIAVEAHGGDTVIYLYAHHFHFFRKGIDQAGARTVQQGFHQFPRGICRGIFLRNIPLFRCEETFIGVGEIYNHLFLFLFLGPRALAAYRWIDIIEEGEKEENQETHQGRDHEHKDGFLHRLFLFPGFDRSGP